jgi:hypothetical protein
MKTHAFRSQLQNGAGLTLCGREVRCHNGLYFMLNGTRPITMVEIGRETCRQCAAVYPLSHVDERAKVARDVMPVKDAPPHIMKGRKLALEAHVAPYPGAPTVEELVAALNRAHKLVDWMIGYVAKMSPGDYHECYADLNEHFLFMERRAARKVQS